MTTDDMGLVREYARRDSEEAFAAIVSCHINLVYSVALRHVRDAHLAEEITQVTFIILARKAGSLGPKTILSGWLCRTARYVSARALTMQERRQFREHEAYMQSALNEPESAAWTRIAPLLDATLAQLGAKDHDAIVLRFFDGKSFKDVGAALGTSEDGAKIRVHRALEKLRRFFAKKGIALPAAVIAGAVSANSVQAAPAVLAKSVAAVALAKGATLSGTTAALINGALKLMAWTKAKTAIVVGLGALLAAGTLTFTAREIAANHHETWQDQYDLLVTDRVPPQVKILPSAGRSVERHVAGEHHGKILGFGKNFPDVMLAAYGWKFNDGQLIFSVPIPAGQYDFISNLPQGQGEALQEELRKKFGLIGRREMRETNVLVLRMRSGNGPGLKRNEDGKTLYSEGPGTLTSHNQSMFAVVDYLRRNVGTLVIDRTGLEGDYDVDFKWDLTSEGLKQALLDQLGLELVPGNESVEFLVVEKAR